MQDIVKHTIPKSWKGVFLVCCLGRFGAQKNIAVFLGKTATDVVR